MRRVFLGSVTAILIVGSATCSKDEAATPAATPAGAPPVTLVSLADLRASVPEFSGWTRGDIAAQEGGPPERSTHVVTTFARGAEKMELEIADTGGAPRAIESLEKIAGSTTSRTVDNGYFKGTIIAGFPAVESWNTVEKIGELSVLIRRRYIVHVAGSGLADAAPMRALAAAVDLSRLR